MKRWVSLTGHYKYGLKDVVLTPGCIWNKWGNDHFNYDHCEYEPQPSTHPIHYVAIIGASEVVRISASTNWPQKYFLRRVFAISLKMPSYCAYLLFRNKYLVITRICYFATKYKPLLQRARQRKLLQILNLRQKEQNLLQKKNKYLL